MHSHAFLVAALAIFWLSLFAAFTWYFGFGLTPREHDDERERQDEDERDREPEDVPLAA